MRCIVRQWANNKKKNITKIGNQLLSCLYLAIEQNNITKKYYMDLSSKAEHNSILLR